MSESKREKRLQAALARVYAAACERYPDEGSNPQRQKARARREAFKAGALWWRYMEAADSAQAKTEGSER